MKERLAPAARNCLWFLERHLVERGEAAGLLLSGKGGGLLAVFGEPAPPADASSAGAAGAVAAVLALAGCAAGTEVAAQRRLGRAVSVSLHGPASQAEIAEVDARSVLAVWSPPGPAAAPATREFTEFAAQLARLLTDAAVEQLRTRMADQAAAPEAAAALEAPAAAHRWRAPLGARARPRGDELDPVT